MILRAYISGGGGKSEVQLKSGPKIKIKRSNFQQLPSHYCLKKQGSPAVLGSPPKFTNYFWKRMQIPGFKVYAISFFLEDFQTASNSTFQIAPGSL